MSKKIRTCAEGKEYIGRLLKIKDDMEGYSIDEEQAVTFEEGDILEIKRVDPSMNGFILQFKDQRIQGSIDKIVNREANSNFRVLTRLESEVYKKKNDNLNGLE